VLRDHFGGAVERPVLTHKLEEVLGLNNATAKMRIQRAIRKGALLKSGKLVTTTDYVTVLPEPLPTQEECPF
jgi:hypothetical protein